MQYLLIAKIELEIDKGLLPPLASTCASRSDSDVQKEEMRPDFSSCPVSNKVVGRWVALTCQLLHQLVP
jgi:hypothetical protein